MTWLKMLLILILYEMVVRYALNHTLVYFFLSVTMDMDRREEVSKFFLFFVLVLSRGKMSKSNEKVQIPIQDVQVNDVNAFVEKYYI